MLYFIILNELCEDGEEVFFPKRKKRKLWSKEWYLQRPEFSHSNLLSELRVSAPADLKKNLRMDSATYDDLLHKVRPLIGKKDTIMRCAITANERLSATLRFLASGQSFEDLKFLTAISPQSLGAIIIETCSVINQVLKEYIQVSTYHTTILILNF